MEIISEFVFVKNVDASFNFNSSAEIFVEIIDVNDNPPLFIRPEYIFRVDEDIPRGTFLGRVEATDLDTTSQGRLEYFIQGKKLINGSIILDFDLDRETLDQVTLLVTVSDEGQS